MFCIKYIARILFAIVLGFFIGLERQLTGHRAGIRINVLICMGTSMFTLFPLIYGSKEVFRVGSAIISGVGFLCSGVIFKENGSVRGINTAATLWCTAAIGILSSTGKYILASLTALCLIISNLILRPLAIRINPLSSTNDETENEYRVSVTCYEDEEPKIREMIIQNNSCKTLFLHNLESGDVTGDKVEVVADFTSVGKPKDSTLESIVLKILKNPNVVRAGWEII